jgi:toxin ParE1/3/4
VIVNFGTRSKRELDAIWAYVAHEDIDAADRLIDRIYAASRRLADFPESGPARPDIAVGVRSLTVGNYLLLYRVGRDAVDVVRVIHGARDTLAALGEAE